MQENLSSFHQNVFLFRRFEHIRYFLLKLGDAHVFFFSGSLEKFPSHVPLVLFNSTDSCCCFNSSLLLIHLIATCKMHSQARPTVFHLAKWALCFASRKFQTHRVHHSFSGHYHFFAPNIVIMDVRISSLLLLIILPLTHSLHEFLPTRHIHRKFSQSLSQSMRSSSGARCDTDKSCFLY